MSALHYNELQSMQPCNKKAMKQYCCSCSTIKIYGIGISAVADVIILHAISWFSVHKQ
jgi:hypothetical protein